MTIPREKARLATSLCSGRGFRTINSNKVLYESFGCNPQEGRIYPPDEVFPPDIRLFCGVLDSPDRSVFCHLIQGVPIPLEV